MLSGCAGVLHWCDRPPDTTCVMFKTGSRLRLAAAPIAAAAVLAACGSNSPTSSSLSGSGGHQSFAAQQQEVVRFANCMRSHGVPNFPDPTTSPRAFKTAFNTKSPAFGSGYTACHQFLPGGGPRQNEQHTHAQIAAFLSFVSCLRSHGFPSFPDPTSTGELTHEMVAAAGINLHQPAVLQAGDACVGVTHGYITRADVARFVAGQ